MAEAFTLETLQERIALSELGKQWINDPLMNQDFWSLLELGYSQEECRINGHYHLYFHKFSLPWLKRLTQLTIKASIRERYSLGRVIHRLGCLNHLDRFLCNYGYTQPQFLTEALLHQFISEINSGNRQNAIAYALNLWKEEQWLEISFIPIKLKQNPPKIETIPEEVLYQIYEKFDLFPPTIERLFRLQLALGCRIGEILTMPRHSLKQEGDKWFLLRWVEKRQHWRFVQIHPHVAELVQEQQRFLDAQFGRDSEFDKLFCTVYTHHQSIPWADRELDTTLFYKPQTITRLRISNWLTNFREAADLKDKHGNRFKLTSHMFRRTKASIMAHCEVEDEYIAAVLGHSSLDMLPHYRQRSLIRLEKEANLKGYVDMYGRVTSFKPRKTRYEKLANLLKVSTPLGECHRPTMLGDCQHRYACLSCPHHRITLSDKSQLEADLNRLQQNHYQAQKDGQERRATEIANLLALIKNRFDGLSELQNLQEQKNHG
jgi:integrase